MGRWAQRRHGCASVSNVTLNFIVSATITDDLAGTALLVFFNDIDPDELAVTDFTSQPTGATGAAIGRTAPNNLEVTFDGPITGDTSVDFNTGAAGFMVPQTKNYTP